MGNLFKAHIFKERTRGPREEVKLKLFNLDGTPAEIGGDPGSQSGNFEVHHRGTGVWYTTPEGEEQAVGAALTGKSIYLHPFDLTFPAVVEEIGGKAPAGPSAPSNPLAGLIYADFEGWPGDLLVSSEVIDRGYPTFAPVLRAAVTDPVTLDPQRLWVGWHNRGDVDFQMQLVRSPSNAFTPPRPVPSWPHPKRDSDFANSVIDATGVMFTGADEAPASLSEYDPVAGGPLSMKLAVRTWLKLGRP